MTGPARSADGAVPWLIAQAVMFGVMAALLGIVANALFLDAFGSTWLPATYIAIGVAGIVVSGAVAQSARSADLVRIALVVLGGAAALIAMSWVLALAGGAWVTAPLLVLFPILIQLGFVFIGSQAGRVLDIAGIKANFPRIMAGFPIGAVVGGLAGGWIVGWTGRTQDLLLATAVAQAAFAGLVWLTGRRYADRSGAARQSVEAPSPPRDPGTAADAVAAPASLRDLVDQPFVMLILAYQILSAVASQLADFLVYDRANTQYADPADLTRFLAGYTAVMNIVSITFLVLLAGPLLRRFGLRLGIAANPVVVGILAMTMVVAVTTAGPASFGLLMVVSAARIADIALTDGTTRTSINATYQVLPERTRLAVQAAVEGMGVPVAIGFTGVLIFVLGVLPFALTATIVVTAAICLVWTWSAVLLYRAYGPALSDALRRRRWLDEDVAIDVVDQDRTVVQELVAGGDPRAMRLGLELATTLGGLGPAPELAALANDTRSDVRMIALAAMALTGDDVARHRLREAVRHDLDAPDVDARLAALEALRPDHIDGDAVGTADASVIESVLRALDDPRTQAAASGAVGRLGDAIVPALAARLDAAAGPISPSTGRLVRAATTSTTARDAVLLRHVGHPDRELGLIILERLASPTAADREAAGVVDRVIATDVRHAARILAAKVGVEAGGDTAGGDTTGGDTAGGDSAGPTGPVLRALDDELELVRRRVTMALLVVHGTDRLGPPLVELASGGPGAATALEALVVAVGPTEAASVAAVLEPGRSAVDRLAVLSPAAPVQGGVGGWLRDLVEDPDGHWRSPWLTACAIRAARLTGSLEGLDLSRAMALRDPVIAEEVALGSAA